MICVKLLYLVLSPGMILIFDMPVEALLTTD